MSLFHFHVTQIKRSAGQSAVACAAYRAGEKLRSEYYGEVSDYTRKGGVVESGIMLPEYVPQNLSDRETLWNAVEKIEKGKKAQLAYSFDFALQNEFTMEENISLAKKFIREQFVERGMIADFAIHSPETNGIANPHVHVLCPIRPIEENGKWGNKQKRVYELDRNGERVTDHNGNYIFSAVPTTDWGKPETLEHWRSEWARMCNEKFEEKQIAERIDYRSQEEVAFHLGVSFQSISKWERGDGYPDIEMLPSIADYFGISVDELLGVSNAEKKAKYDEINKKWLYYNEKGFHSENAELMKNALKMYPNDALLLVQLSTSLEKINGTEEEKKKYLLESIAVQEQIIRYCDDCEVRGATLYNICFAYWKIGEHDKAIEQAEKLPNLYKSRENALVYFLTGDAKRKVAKEALEPLAWGIKHHLTALSETENNPVYLEKATKIINILFDED